ncbi:unnamed protein product [Urochloa humidicola]
MPRNSPSFDLIVESVFRLPCHQRARRLRRLFRHQVQASVHRYRAAGRTRRGMEASHADRGRRHVAMMQMGGRTGGRRCRGRGATATRRTDTRAIASRAAGHTHQHLPPPPDACVVPGRILIHDPRHCVERGWTAVLRVEDYPWSEMLPAVVSSYYPQYGWMNFTRDEARAGPSSAAPATRLGTALASRTPSPMAISPARFASPVGTMAARRNRPPFYSTTTAASSDAAALAPTNADPAPPPSPPAPTAAPCTISTGHRHVPNGIGGHPNRAASGGCLSSDEGEA